MPQWQFLDVVCLKAFTQNLIGNYHDIDFFVVKCFQPPTDSLGPVVVAV